MIHVQDSEEMNLLRNSLQSFAKKEIEPYYHEWEKQGRHPRELWNKLGENGLLAVDIPEKYGGLGAPLLYSATIIDEFTKLGYASISTNLSVHSDIIAHYLLKHGTEEQKQHYLPKMVTGELVSAIAMTEPDAGSDLQGIQTNAVWDEETEKYILNGSKTFITNGQHFDFAVVVTRTNKEVKPSRGTSLFIVDAELPGVVKGKALNKIGLHAADTSELIFDEVPLSKDKLLGPLDKGFPILMNELPRERLIIAVAATGAIEGALELTVNYVNERHAFGKPLAKIQVIRHQIADMIAEAKVNRAYINRCLELLENNELTTSDASIAKLTATESQGRIIDGCLQIFGGYGYMEEYPISRFYKDARVQRIYGGTSEIMKEIISKNILDSY